MAKAKIQAHIKNNDIVLLLSFDARNLLYLMFICSNTLSPKSPWTTVFLQQV